MPIHQDIGELHRKLSIKASGVLDQQVAIRPVPSHMKYWERLRAGSKLPFELLPHHKGTPWETALRARGGRQPSGRVNVFSLCGVTSADGVDTRAQAWVAWYERWTVVARREFELLTAGWTVFWGLPGEENKIQVLRADWDQIKYTGEFAESIGQPHWHVDQPVVADGGGIRYWSGPSPNIPGELPPRVIHDEAVAPTDASAVRAPEIRGLHLAMATWERAEHPLCWQRAYEGQCEDLFDWASKTLLYVRDHFDPLVVYVGTSN